MREHVARVFDEARRQSKPNIESWIARGRADAEIMALGFLSSAIKSGEPWSEQCDAMKRAAFSALDSICLRHDSERDSQREEIARLTKEREEAAATPTRTATDDDTARDVRHLELALREVEPHVRERCNGNAVTSLEWAIVSFVSLRARLSSSPSSTTATPDDDLAWLNEMILDDPLGHVTFIANDSAPMRTVNLYLGEAAVPVGVGLDVAEAIRVARAELTNDPENGFRGPPKTCGASDDGLNCDRKVGHIGDHCAAVHRPDGIHTRTW